MKTSELTGPALDWAVAKCEGITYFGAPQGRTEAMEFLLMHPDDPDLQFSTNWSQGGPIIEREGVSIKWVTADEWMAVGLDNAVTFGPTPLIAAMRCYVASELGDEVDIPEILR